MKKVFVVLIGVLLLMSSCYRTTVKTFSKNGENVLIEVAYDDGSKNTSTLANPKVSQLKKQGLDECDAMELTSKGGRFQINSFELTSTGIAIVIIICVIILIIVIAAGGLSDGFFWGMLTADALDDD